MKLPQSFNLKNTQNTKYKIQNTNYGFSFIELLVALSISGLLLGVLLANFGGFNKSKKISESSDELVTNLRSISTKGFSGDKPCDASQTLDGYKVDYISKTEYKIRPICSGSPNGSYEQSYSLSNNVEFASSWSSFTFYPLDNGVSDNRTINLSLDDLDLKVNVATTGAIYVANE